MGWDMLIIPLSPPLFMGTAAWSRTWSPARRDIWEQDLPFPSLL